MRIIEGQVSQAHSYVHHAHTGIAMYNSEATSFAAELFSRLIEAEGPSSPTELEFDLLLNASQYSLPVLYLGVEKQRFSAPAIIVTTFWKMRPS